METRLISENLVVQARQLIDDAAKIVVLSHISPDGDAVGSSVAMCHLLKSFGKEATAVLPNHFPNFFRWLDGSDAILVYERDNRKVQQLIAAADLVICQDFNDLKRINGIKPLVEVTKAKKLVIDHHLFPNIEADVVISYPECSSTSLLVYSLIDQMGYKNRLTKSAAEGIYLGMMTDTGNFSYNSQAPEIYEAISDLLKIGIDKDAIYQKTYNNYSEHRMRLMGLCLSQKMTLYWPQQTAVISLTKQELDDHHIQVGETDGFVNIPLSIEGICRSIFVREEEKKVKLSFRSQGDVAVNTIAAEHFGGGGHQNAAGGESYISLDETLKKLDKIIKQL